MAAPELTPEYIAEVNAQLEAQSAEQVRIKLIKTRHALINSNVVTVN